MRFFNVLVLMSSFMYLLGCSNTHAPLGNKDKRQVGSVVWYKRGEDNSSSLANRSVSGDSVGLFFFRKGDADGLPTSSNIAINGRFQVSLQPGNFSYVRSCPGVNDLSVDITGNKHNDLRRGLASYVLKSGHNYYFDIDVSSSGNARITKVPKEKALSMMNDMPRQTHQISRVVPGCTPIEARIKLDVLFDTGKSFVKERYYPEIKRVAIYMKKYTKTRAVIEGHTDSRAGAAYNKGLSQRRAKAVMNVLVQHFGISSSRLTARGYGEERPIASNKTSTGRQQNRRVIAAFSQ